MKQEPACGAAKILKPETIRYLRTGGYTARGYAILDRWATNQPDELRHLEARGEMAMDLELYSQQEMESRALLRPEAMEMSRRGMSDWEILEALEINTILRIIE